MGYGKGGKKGKQALYREFEELSSQRTLCIVGIVIGAVVLVASLILQTISQGTTGLFDEGTASGLLMGSFVGIAAGGVVAAISVIKFVAVNEDYKKVVAKMK